MKKLFLICLAAGLFFIQPAFAAGKVVIELFTSQGCDMCPPAHVLQKEYSQMPEIIALTWHVEHWDFMGWRDTFAKEEFTRRHYLYNKLFDRKGVYTPQAIVNGRRHIVASNKLELYTAIREALIGNPTPVDIKFGPGNNRFVIEVEGSKISQGARILFLWVKSSDSVKVNSGANIGKTFESMNIVRYVDEIGTLKETPQKFPINLSDPNRGDADMIAVLVQENDVGPIIGAALVRVQDLNR